MKKINTLNKQVWTAELERVQKLSRIRTIEPERMQELIEETTLWINQLLPVTYQTGVKVLIDDNAQGFPASYNGIPESTQFTLIKGSKDWFINNITRTAVKPPSRRMEAFFNDEQKAKIVEFISKKA